MKGISLLIYRADRVYLSRGASENYPTSQSIGAPLFRQIEESGADLVVTDCETCKWQIEMSTSKRCEHPITLLAKALG